MNQIVASAKNTSLASCDNDDRHVRVDKFYHDAVNI